jgi:hypothetical protein
MAYQVAKEAFASMGSVGNAQSLSGGQVQITES